jgi:3-methylfumaryl-CoA hydratase
LSAPSGLVPGQRIPDLVVTASTRQLVQYAAASRDFYEAHYDLEFARANNLPGVILHGLFKLALFGRAMTEWAGPDCFVRELSATYRGLDLVNEPFRVEASVVDATTDDGLHVVSLELKGVSAQGKPTTFGTGVVDFPT